MPLVCFPCLVILSAALYTDIRWKKIPNTLTLPAIMCGLCFHGMMNAAAEGFSFALSGCLTGGLFLLIPFAMGGVGGGDVKLLGALGAWLGAEAVFSVFLYSAMIGGVMAGILLIGKRRSARSGKPSDLIYSLPITLGFLCYLMLGTLL
jgi:prepilin peptidase CpaA